MLAVGSDERHSVGHVLLSKIMVRQGRRLPPPGNWPANTPVKRDGRRVRCRTANRHCRSSGASPTAAPLRAP